MAAHHNNDKSLDAALTAFIAATATGHDGLVKLGRTAAAAAPREPTAEERKALLGALTTTQAASRSIVWLWAAMIVALFVLTAGFAVYQRDNVAVVATSILGGSGVMVFLFAQVRNAHKDLVSTQLLLALLPNLPLDEWTKTAAVLRDEIVRRPQ